MPNGVTLRKDLIIAKISDSSSSWLFGILFLVSTDGVIHCGLQMICSSICIFSKFLSSPLGNMLLNSCSQKSGVLNAEKIILAFSTPIKNAGEKAFMKLTGTT